MPEFQGFNERLNQIREAVTAKMPDIAVALTLSAKAMAERRIVDKGFGALYSQSVYPAWFLFGKDLNAKGRQFLIDRGVHESTGEQGEPKKKRRKKGETAEPGKFDPLTNWAQFRQAQGLQTQHVDLHYSNKMFAAMQPGRVEMRGRIVVAPLGASNVEAQNKMNWNRERYGDFIGKAINNEADRKILTDVVIQEVVAVLEQFK